MFELFLFFLDISTSLNMTKKTKKRVAKAGLKVKENRKRVAPKNFNYWTNHDLSLRNHKPLIYQTGSQSGGSIGNVKIWIYLGNI